jgi:antitoxin component HigA of HigAB toxin-antitoxin module
VTEPIRDHADLARVTAVVDRLLCSNLDDEGQSLLDDLTDIIEAYEAVHFPIGDEIARPEFPAETTP